MNKNLVFLGRLARQLIVSLAIKARNAFFAVKVVFGLKNWKDYFLDAKGKLKGKIEFTCKGKKYRIRAGTKDRDILAEIALGNEYFTDKMDLADAIVFDVGAQAGIFSVFVSDKAKKVFSFEPVPENFSLLKENIELNNIKNVKAFNVALAGKKGKEKIYLNENNSGGHSVYGKGKFVEVNSTTIEGAMKENNIEKIDLLKMDIEGAEYKIFYSMKDETLKKIQRIAMECHEIDKNKNNPKSLVAFFEKKGFKVKQRKSLYNFTVILAEKAFP